MKNILLLLLTIPTLLLSQSYDWQNSAPKIDEAANNDGQGPTALSDNGSVIIIGASQADDNGSNSGHVRVFQHTSGFWSQIGSDIDGVAAEDKFGYSVTINSDGSIIAAGGIHNDDNGNNSGHVRVFENISGTWTQIGSDIDGEAVDDQFGVAVSLSSDGSIIAIGANMNDGGNYNAGHVRVFENISGVWTQIGSDIDGQSYGEEFGYRLSLNSDGTILAVGAYASSSGDGTARIYENISGTWTQIGSDIDGEGSNDEFGTSISLNSNGNIVAIGGSGNDANGSNSGYIRVFENISGVWTQRGSDIDGNSTMDYFGNSVTLSNDGLTLSGSATGSGGYIRVMEYNSTLTTPDWVQKGSVILGNNYYLESMSGDGLALAASSQQSSNRYVQTLQYSLISKTYVPDDTFEDYLESNGMGDGVANNDSVLTSNIEYVTDLAINAGSMSNSNGIADFTGIDGFSALDELNLSNHHLATSLDLSGLSSLTKLTINDFNYLFTLITS